MSMSDSDAVALIAQARTGCSDSLGKLLDGYRHLLLRIANESVGDNLRPKMPPSDMVQGSLLIATRDFQKFRGDSENELRAWLIRILSTRLSSGMRRFLDSEKRRVDREVDGGIGVARQTPDPAESPSDVLSMQEETARLLGSIQALPEELREIVQARYLEGKTFVEISEQLNLPVTTCRRRWLDAVEAIGLAIDPERQTDPETDIDDD